MAYKISAYWIIILNFTREYFNHLFAHQLNWRRRNVHKNYHSLQLINYSMRALNNEEFPHFSHFLHEIYSLASFSSHSGVVFPAFSATALLLASLSLMRLEKRSLLLMELLSLLLASSSTSLNDSIIGGCCCSLLTAENSTELSCWSA